MQNIGLFAWYWRISQYRIERCDFNLRMLKVEFGTHTFTHARLVWLHIIANVCFQLLVLRITVCYVMYTEPVPNTIDFVAIAFGWQGRRMCQYQHSFRMHKMENCLKNRILMKQNYSLKFVRTLRHFSFTFMRSCKFRFALSFSRAYQVRLNIQLINETY